MEAVITVRIGKKKFTLTSEPFDGITPEEWFEAFRASLGFNEATHG